MTIDEMIARISYLRSPAVSLHLASLMRVSQAEANLRAAAAMQRGPRRREALGMARKIVAEFDAIV